MVTGYWERLGAGFHPFRSCVNPLGVPDNLTAALDPFEKNPGKFQWRQKSQLCCNRGSASWAIYLQGRQARRASSAGKSSKYIYVLFSPQKALVVNSVLFRYLRLVYFTPFARSSHGTTAG